MCRVILTNRNDFELFDKEYGVERLFDHLEKECGGHGNGYALIRDGKIIETRKGKKLSNEEIYKKIKQNKKWQWLIWHTRISSIGATTDSNCHPFVRDNDALAMNGTEHNLQGIANAFNCTDTEIIFKNMAGLSVSSATQALVELGSVFVGCANGTPFAVQAGGTLHRWNKGDKTLHASTFIAGTKKVEKIEDGYINIEGKADYSYTYKKGYSDWDYLGYLTGGDKTTSKCTTVGAEYYDWGFEEGYETGYKDALKYAEKKDIEDCGDLF